MKWERVKLKKTVRSNGVKYKKGTTVERRKLPRVAGQYSPELGDEYEYREIEK